MSEPGQASCDGCYGLGWLARCQCASDLCPDCWSRHNGWQPAHWWPRWVARLLMACPERFRLWCDYKAHR